jgi:hypothetical protein
MTKPLAQLQREQEASLYSGATVTIALISGDLTLNMATTCNASTNTFTTASVHSLPTGARIRLAIGSLGGDVLPGSVNGVTDYFVINLSSTSFKLATTLDNANLATEIDITSNGQGVLLNQQLLGPDDSNAVIFSRELPSGNGYTQRAQPTVGASTINGVEAWQSTSPANFSASGGALVYRHVALLKNGNSTIGDTNGDLLDLRTETANVTIANGNIKTLVQRFINQRG